MARRQEEEREREVQLKSAYEAYKAWRDVCHNWIRQQKSVYGRRFVGASCGIPQNIHPSATFGYLTYRSAARVLVRE